MLIGQQSGPSSNYKEIRESMRDANILDKWNHGMATPASYERAVAATKLANQEKRIIITFLDTPGADPTEAAEEGGIAWRIGNIIQGLAETKRPTLSIILNRGCSGGAIALTGCDLVLAMEILRISSYHRKRHHPFYFTHDMKQTMQLKPCGLHPKREKSGNCG